MQSELRPIVSLIGKSEKALQKLSPGTWQHTMLQSNLKALRLALSLLTEETDNAKCFTRDDLQEALDAIASMIARSEKARAKFADELADAVARIAARYHDDRAQGGRRFRLLAAVHPVPPG